LDELHLKPTAIAGASAGAIAGALYAAGKTASEILELLKSNSFFGWGNIAWRKKGIFTMDTVQKLLQEIIKEDNFKALSIPLFVAATDLNKGQSVIFSEGALFKAIIASASVPVFFEPVKLENMLLVDGGVLNNFPVESLRGNCDIIIGSHVNKQNHINANTALGTRSIIDRCFHLAISNSVYSKAGLCNIMIEPDLQAYEMFDVKNADTIFEIGYKKARQFKEELLQLMD
jgi:NTE family protein